MRHVGGAARRGGALVAALVIVVALAGIAASIFGVSVVRNDEARSKARETRALYLAETGLSEALMTVAVAKRDDQPVPAVIGTRSAPVEHQQGSFWCELRDNGDESFDVLVHGRAGVSERALAATLAPVGGSVFDHAIFAGNRSGDPAYVLELSGVGLEADRVVGDVYSGNDVELAGDATVTGEIVATGTITGASGQEGPTRPLPDIAGMAYSMNNDVDVAAIFDTEGVWASDALGGSAFQVPEVSPAHIFRKNPDNRIEETSGTAKDDYFLEDPHESVITFGGSGHTITLAGVDGEPGAGGNDVVYYVDGNLWVHNTTALDFKFNRGATPTRITFVVRGNVYFSDNVLLEDSVTDGVAFIAIEDADEPDSGNIYLGDPRFGTVERMETFLYAENDFVDVNLSATGSKEVTIVGNMTAGDQVRIERDFVLSDGGTVHSKLAVEFDDRLSTGALELPGIPRTRGAGLEGYAVVLWREVALQ